MRFRIVSVAITLAASLASWAGLTPALAENRIALVMGNSAYRAVPQLPNPANDAQAMADLLTTAGFEVVSTRDLTQADLRRAVGEFARKAAAKGPDTVALVYYAGHGVQVDGDNYLVPVDAQIGGEADVPLQALRLGDLMNALAAVPTKTRIVILDACRNNPFSEINKVAGRGLAMVDAPNGSIISYSTAPGSEAEDGRGDHSPYTTALLQFAREQGLPIEQVFKRMRYSVHQATGGRQTPWESSSLTGDFAFFGTIGVAVAQAQTTGTTGSAPVQLASYATGSGATAEAASHSVDYWQQALSGKTPEEAYVMVVRDDTVEAYKAYMAVFGTAPLAVRVRILLDRRVVAIAWHETTLVNTTSAYEAFIAAYPDGDYTASARRLMERRATRSLANVCTLGKPERRADISIGSPRAMQPVLATPVTVSKPAGGQPASPATPVTTPPVNQRPPVVMPVTPPVINPPVVTSLPPVVLQPPVIERPPVTIRYPIDPPKPPVTGPKPGSGGYTPPGGDKPGSGVYTPPGGDKPGSGVYTPPGGDKTGSGGNTPPVIEKPGRGVNSPPVLGKPGRGTTVLDRPGRGTTSTTSAIGKTASGSYTPRSFTEKPLHTFNNPPRMSGSPPRMASGPLMAHRPMTMGGGMGRPMMGGGGFARPMMGGGLGRPMMGGFRGGFGRLR